MTGFNEGSAAQERPTGHQEGITQHQPGMGEPNDAPTGRETSDRYQLGDNGAWLLRKFTIVQRADNSAYFAPIASVLKEYQLEGEACVESARKRHALNDERVAMADLSITTKSADFLTETEINGEGREWLGRKRILWPLTDELGQHCYNAIAGRHELREYAVALVKGADDNIKSVEDAKASEKYEKKSFWARLALEEAGLVDAVIQGVEETTYNLPAMIATGYRAEANRATRTYLTGATEHTTGNAETKALLEAADTGYDEL